LTKISLRGLLAGEGVRRSREADAAAAQAAKLSWAGAAARKLRQLRDHAGLPELAPYRQLGYLL